MHQNASKWHPKIISIMIKSSGLWGSVVWRKLNLGHHLINRRECLFPLGNGRGRLFLRPPTGGLVEAPRSVMEGSVYSDALELVRLGVTGLAEEAPPFSASSPTNFFLFSGQSIRRWHIFFTIRYLHIYTDPWVKVLSLQPKWNHQP
jgi:hypothetical protein